jgi:hypothetical protein
MANWKRHERETAKALGGERHVRSNFSESAVDVEHPVFSVECKYRKRLPKLMTDAMAQAASYTSEKIPLAVLKEKGRRGAFAILRLDDFKNILTNGPGLP